MEFMNYCDFLVELEFIAISKGLRLFMNRSPVGSGFFFYFHKDGINKRSDYVTFDLLHHNPEELFERLNDVADKFNKELSETLYTLLESMESIEN